MVPQLLVAIREKASIATVEEQVSQLEEENKQ
jgi:hypothetical protein